MELQKLYVSLLMEMKEYTAGLDDAIGQARGFGDRLKGALGGAAQAAGMAVVGGLAVAGGALVGLGASSVGVATEFQSSMAIMSTAVDPLSVGAQTTAEAMDILGDASLAVGSDTALVGVSASTSAEAITGLYKAGLSTSEIFGDLQGYMSGTAELSGALRASIDLAAASELDMVQASDLAAVTLATFGGHLETEAERAEFINSAMNNFVQTADASVASVGDLQAAFVNVGPTAAAFGFSVEDTNAALGILSTRGITGSEAGTALKSMLNNLMRTTPEVTETLEALNVELYNSDGTMRALPNIISQLEDSMAGMTEEQRNQTVATLAGSYGMNAMNTLLGEGVEGWMAMTGAVGEAATMQESAAARTNTLAGAQEALSGVWESFQIKVGTALVPVLTQLADVGARLIEKYGPTLTAIFETVGEVLGNLFDNLEEGMSPLDAFIEAIWDIAPPELLEALVNFRDNILPSLTEKFHQIVDPIVAAVTNFVSFKDVLIGLGIVILAAVIPAVVSLVLSMAPILLAVAAVIAVVALLRNAWENNWGGIRDKVQAVIDFIVPFIQNAIAAIRQWWDENGAAILDGVRSVWESVKQIIELAINLIKIIVGAALSLIKALWDRFGDDIMATIRFAWDTVKTIIGTAIENVKLIIGAFIDLFTGDWEGFKEKIGQIWQNTWDAVVSILGNLWGLLQPKLLEIWDNIRGWFDDKIEDFKQLGRDVINGIINGLDEVGDKIRQTLVDWATRAWDSVKEFFGINSPATKGKDAGKNIGEGLIEGVLESGDDFWSRTEVVFDAYYADIEDWYTSRPWEEMPEYTIDVWQEYLQLLWPVTGPRYGEYYESVTEWWTARPWESMPEYTIAVFEAKFATMSERLAPTYEDFFQTSILVFREQDWAIIGSQIVDGVVHGVNSNAGKLEEAMRAIARRAKEAADAELGVSSPAKEMIPTGEAIVNGIIAGVLNRREALAYGLETIVSDVEDILSQAGDAGGIAGGFAKRFTDSVIAPMEARLESLGGRVEAVQDLFKTRMGSELITDVSHYGDTLRQLLMLRNTLTTDPDSEQQLALVEDALEALRERGRLNQEYIQQQERLLALEKARADVDFLKSQLELLKLVQENGMDASVLAGLEFGLDADAGALMDTMVDVMRRLVQSAEDELGIHSPSAWARDTMRNVMQTMAATAEQERVSLNDSLSRALQPALGAATAGASVGARTTDNSRRTAIYGGYHVTVESGRDSWLEEQAELMR